MRELLEDSLALWRLGGSVDAEGEGAVVRADCGRTVRVARGRAARWEVCSDTGLQRDCASVAGVLSAIRDLLEVSGGPGLRIAPLRVDR